MIILGDSDVSNEIFSTINCIEDIIRTSSNSTVVFDYDKKLMIYAKNNNLQYAVKITNIKELIYANTLDAKYILVSDDILELSQKLADNYMFDSKIIATIKDESSIEDIAIEEIDGIIFSTTLIKIG